MAYLARVNGFSYASGAQGIQIVGVDISALMNQNITVLKPSKKPYAFNPNIPMASFFYQLCRFSRAPVVFVFVFDGPDRPDIKRQNPINTGCVPWWTEPCKEVIEAFGFYAHQAPGEAEAELAAMNAEGVINAVLGPDSDVFAFGAKTVMRRVAESVDEYEVYSAQKMNEMLGIRRSGFILIALLAGGDYSSGIDKIGAGNGACLARAGLGDALEKIVHQFSSQDFNYSLKHWSQELKRELSTNSRGFLGGKMKAMARLIPSDFPDPKIVNLYFNPITSWSTAVTGSSGQVPSSMSWVAREPDLKKLAVACSNIQRAWRTRDILAKKLYGTLWEGVVLRMLTVPGVHYDKARRHLISPTHDLTLDELKFNSKRKNQPGDWARIKIFTSPLIDALDVPAGEEDVKEKYLSIRVWTPREYLPPGMEAFKSKTTRSIVKKPKPSEVQSPSPDLNIFAFLERGETPPFGSPPMTAKSGAKPISKQPHNASLCSVNEGDGPMHYEGPCNWKKRRLG
ncbi:hypothetical protein D9613_010504 [Agrocybe pediades]|uniref:XPG-I domain-containing protein n=1 Tax=Agrocybe pediades TaxID=84607 RepID=A0A8H4QF62_9AGAR|nr:hypothetical protein D9613_010504 [Agrocybe pediades]